MEAIHRLPVRQAIVAHFDMLGTTELIERNFELACACLGDLYEAARYARLPISDRDVVREVTFSDTVLLYAEDDGSDSLRAVIARSVEYFIAAFRAGIPVRGGIAGGRMVFCDEPPRFFGESLAKAYRLGESQAMLGVAVEAELATRFLDRPFTHETGAAVLVRWPAPACSAPGEEPRYVLNWPAFVARFLGGRSETPAQFYGRFKGVGLAEFDRLPSEVKGKYQTTVEFLEHHFPPPVEEGAPRARF
jgi:hypothetical protein